MKLKLHTDDIQKLMICILFSKDTSVVSEEDKQRYVDILTKLNNMCNKDNNYTLGFMVDEIIH